MADLNDISDALVTIVTGLDEDVRFYAEPSEKPLAGTSGAGVDGEVYFRDLKRIGNGPAGRWEVTAEVELSTPANKPAWGAAVRRIREVCSPSGARSLLAAIEDNAGSAGTTLGGVVVGCLPLAGSSLADEVRKKYPDGDRWTQAVRLRVTFAP